MRPESQHKETSKLGEHQEQGLRQFKMVFLVWCVYVCLWILLERRLQNFMGSRVDSEQEREGDM